MKLTWTEGLEPDVAKEIRGDFISSHLVRKRLTKILNDKIETSHASLRQKDIYDKPNFGVIVADTIGYERAMQEVISLLTSPEK
jgi:uncharacterized protein YlxP (DUF503 family)